MSLNDLMIWKADAAAANPQLAAPRWRLWAEFLALFVIAPAALAAWISAIPLFPAIIGASALGMALLWATPGFHWRELVDLRGLKGQSGLILGFALVATTALTALVWLMVPDQFLWMPRNNPRLWILILIFYPLLSVLGQEILYRALFFQRYGALFPNDAARIMVNGAVFAFAHLLFQHWLPITATFFAGLFFGAVYLRGRSFPLVFILHWIGGGLVFTLGLGRFFYHMTAGV